MINKMWVEQMAEIVFRIKIKTTERPVVCKKEINNKNRRQFWIECLSTSDTDRVVLGRRELVEVLRNKLQHQQTSPGNANAVLSPIYVYKTCHAQGRRQKQIL